MYIKIVCNAIHIVGIMLKNENPDILIKNGNINKNKKQEILNNKK